MRTRSHPLAVCAENAGMAWCVREDGPAVQVLKGNDNKAVHVQILFSTVFMISCSMFSLVLFEGETSAPSSSGSGVPHAVPVHARQSMFWTSIATRLPRAGLR